MVEVVDEKNGWPVRFLGGGGGLGGGLDEICWKTKMEVFPHGSWHCVFFLTERLIKCIEQVTLASWLSLFDSMYRVPSSIHLFIYLLCIWFYLHHASFFPGILNFLLCLVILG